MLSQIIIRIFSMLRFFLACIFQQNGRVYSSVLFFVAFLFRKIEINDLCINTVCFASAQQYI